MRMTIALPYTMKDSDRLGMLRQEEQDAYNALLADALGDLPLGHPRAVLAAREVQRVIITPMGQQLAARITTALFERAVRAKFKEHLVRKDRRLWTSLLERLEEDPEQVDVSAEEATWIADLFAEKILDGFPADLARFVNVLEDEIERLRQALKDPAALQPAE